METWFSVRSNECRISKARRGNRSRLQDYLSCILQAIFCTLFGVRTDHSGDSMYANLPSYKVDSRFSARSLVDICPQGPGSFASTWKSLHINFELDHWLHSIALLDCDLQGWLQLHAGRRNCGQHIAAAWVPPDLGSQRLALGQLGSVPRLPTTVFQPVICRWRFWSVIGVSKLQWVSYGWLQITLS